MSTDLRRALSNLAERAPDAPAGLASAALREATRRRRRRVVVPVVMSVVGVLVLLGFPGLLAPLGRLAPVTPALGPGVLGHPVRVQAPLPWQHRSLTGAPGRMAGLVRDRDGYWHLVTPDGGLVDLPPATMITPTLSEDGRQLAYLRRDGGVLVTRDLLSGKVRRHPALPTNGTGPRTMGSALPVFWSHDGTRIAVPVGRPNGRAGEGSVVVLDVRADAVVDVEVRGALAGWGVGDATLVSVGSAPPAQAGEGTDLVVHRMSLRTGEVHSDRVQVGGFRAEMASTSFASVSVTGARLGLSRSSYVDVVDIGRSRWVGGSGNADGAMAGCGRPSWHGSRPVALTQDDPVSGDTGGTRLQAPPAFSNRIFTVFDPRLDVVCADMVSAALDGPPIGGSTWGLSTSWWSWRWREASGLSIVVIAAVAAVARRARRRQAT